MIESLRSAQRAADACTIFWAASAQAVGGDDRAGRDSGQDLLALLDVRAFEAHDQRHLERDLLGRRDHAARR